MNKFRVWFEHPGTAGFDVVDQESDLPLEHYVWRLNRKGFWLPQGNVWIMPGAIKAVRATA